MKRSAAYDAKVLKASRSRQEQAAALFAQGLTSAKVGETMGICRKTADNLRRAWERRTGNRLPRFVSKSADGLTPALEAVLKLCDGTMTTVQMAAELGVTRATIGDRIHRIREITGKPPKFKRLTTANPLTPEEREKLREVERALEAAPTCDACGMTKFPSKISVHACPPRRVEEFVRSGTTNLGTAERFR